MKISKRIDLSNPLYMTFFIAFLSLTGSTIITVLGSLFKLEGNKKYIKNALISESAVNIIASLTYFYFLQYLYEESIKLDKITSIRYIDWILTTPLLLLSFVFYADYQKREDKDEAVDYTPLSYIFALNMLMLFFGFLGETKRYNKLKSFLLGFAAFAGLFYFLYDSYVKDNSSVEAVYWVLFAIWSLYGVAYYLPIKSKNIAYNVLDMLSKSGFGIFLWISAINVSN